MFGYESVRAIKCYIKEGFSDLVDIGTNSFGEFQGIVDNALFVIVWLPQGLEVLVYVCGQCFLFV